jgi:hypothetical protein
VSTGDGDPAESQVAGWSFATRDRRGRFVPLTPLYRRPAGGSAPSFAPEALVGLRTDRGQPVERLARGRYRVAATGEELLSQDPSAV